MQTKKLELISTYLYLYLLYALSSIVISIVLPNLFISQLPTPLPHIPIKREH